jgi:hypothetical protein
LPSYLDLHSHAIPPPPCPFDPQRQRNSGHFESRARWPRRPPQPLILLAEVSFGNVKIGQSKTKTITLSNPNEAEVAIFSIFTTGPFGAP